MANPGYAIVTEGDRDSFINNDKLKKYLGTGDILWSESNKRYYIPITSIVDVSLLAPRAGITALTSEIVPSDATIRVSAGSQQSIVSQTDLLNAHPPLPNQSQESYQNPYPFGIVQYGNDSALLRETYPSEIKAQEDMIRRFGSRYTDFREFPGKIIFLDGVYRVVVPNSFLAPDVRQQLTLQVPQIRQIPQIQQTPEQIGNQTPNPDTGTQEAQEASAPTNMGLPAWLRDLYIQGGMGENKDFDLKRPETSKPVGEGGGWGSVLGAIVEGAGEGALKAANKRITGAIANRQFLQQTLPQAEQAYGESFHTTEPNQEAINRANSRRETFGLAPLTEEQISNRPGLSTVRFNSALNDFNSAQELMLRKKIMDYEAQIQEAARRRDFARQKELMKLQAQTYSDLNTLIAGYAAPTTQTTGQQTTR